MRSHKSQYESPLLLTLKKTLRFSTTLIQSSILKPTPDLRLQYKLVSTKRSRINQKG